MAKETAAETEELLRLIIQLIEKFMEQLVKILEQITAALIETLPNQD